MTVRTVSANVREQLGPASASAVASLAPSMLSNLMVSLESVSPGISGELLRSPSGALRRVPGMHNDVFSEVRENSNPASARINQGKFDPRAVTKVQLASALCERDLVADGAIVDPLEAANELDRIETRIDAIASGAIIAPAPGTTFDQLPEPVQKFYRRHTLDEVGGLTAVAQRMSDKLFEDVTEQAQVAATPRAPSPLVAGLATADHRPPTVSDLLKSAPAAGVDTAAGVEIAEGVKLVTGTNGGASVLVDGLRLPVDGDSRLDELIARIPAVDFDQFTHVPSGGNSSGLNTVVQSVMVGKSPRAQSLRLAARRRIIERTFYGDTPIGYTAGADGRLELLAGKARAHTAGKIASRPHSSRHRADAEAQTARIEGFDLSRHLRYARAARQEFVAKGIPADLLVTRADEAPLKRYAGPVPTPDRDAAARVGFRVRHRSNTLDADYPGAREALKVDWDSTEAVSPMPPGKALCPEHSEVRTAGVALVTAANQVARHGRNPELAGAGPLLAEAKLASAFQVYKVARGRDHTPRVLTATHPVPPSYRGRETDFVRDVFPAGGAFTTSGYTLARSDGASRGGTGRVRVRYFTGDGMPITGGHVIDAGTTFRVMSSEVAADGTVEVRAVADQVAARAAASAQR
ncbi:hypothetical protein [Mycolicibacterium sp.]|uniref:hypothetical protein n=1 Tax=Mycolicibacterium sp. TaxID=2320850 RepID=UPI00356B294E